MAQNIEQLRQALLTAYRYLLLLRERLQAPMPEQTPQGIEIYNTAKALLGTDASPRDIAPSSLACAETVNYIVTKATGAPIGGGVSTYVMWQCLREFTARWEQVLDPLPGDIVISPTNSNPGARLKHGHVGIVGYYGILSNNSEDGHLEENFNIASWKAYYSDFGGLPMLFYRCLA